ncbi:hypothetical protein FS749_003656 [Ceratobasidium sp. UAMH 11750]|nr:hypothetical protein FS749_003656 [Ceratobasidium sp. UAMH 11750]
MISSNLRVIHSPSTSASIDSLPPELLSGIFALTCPQCLMNELDIRLPLVMPIVLSGVCALWRQLSLSMDSLWCHIDINMGGTAGRRSYLLAKHLLACSKSSPLSIHISEQHSNLPMHYVPSQLEIKRLVDCLHPLMPRVSSLEIATQLTHPLPRYMLELVSSWIWYSSIGSATILKLGSPEFPRNAITNPQILLYMRSCPAGQIAVEKLEAFFRSLHTLHLHYSFIPWDNAIYQDLVELCITGEGKELYKAWFPTQSQLAGVLAACPKLRTLKFDGLGVLPDHQFTPSPITLKYLDVLSLQYASLISAPHRLILPLIGSGSASLDMALSLSHDLEFVAAAHSFFARSNVTRLYAHMEACGSKDCLSMLLGSLPHIRTLALRYCEISDRAMDDFIQTYGQNADPWPRLENLYLLDCYPKLEPLKRLVALHPVRELKITNSRAGNTPAELKQLQVALSTSIPYVLCSTRYGDDPLKHWDFV